jgi:hypothetical protein
LEARALQLEELKIDRLRRTADRRPQRARAFFGWVHRVSAAAIEPNLKLAQRILCLDGMY